MIEFVEVVFPLPLDTPLYYSVSTKEINKINEGVRVIVSLRNKKMTGIVVKLLDTIPSKIIKECKNIEEIVDEDPILPRSILKLTRKLSEYYFVPWGEFIKLSLPPTLFFKTVSKVYITEKAKDKKFIRSLSKEEKNLLKFIGVKSYSINFLKRKFKDATYLLTKLRKKGFVEIKDEFKKIKRRKSSELFCKQFYQMELEPIISYEEKSKINKIIDALDKKEFSSFLLFANETKRLMVYLELIKKTLSQGRKILYILPEITLVESVISELNKKVNANISTLHSDLTVKQRENNWLKIRNNNYEIVVGSRSAIFSPLENLGLIIVDQEEDQSYFFQKDYPFYNLKHVAQCRAEIERAVLVLGSETPCVETYYNACKKKNLILLEEDKKISSIIIAYNSKTEKRNIGRTLREKIEKELSNNRQIIIFINRKGDEEFLICRDCGYLLRCKQCSYPFHIYKKEKLICYICNYTLSSPSICPFCNGKFKKIKSRGTRVIEEELQFLFPNVKISRFDSEVIKNKKVECKIINDFNKGKIKILVGTQFLTYCNSLKKVSLIGVLFPENMLGFSDYKGGEKVFQIVRKLSKFLSNQGKVLIQTSFPENYIIQCLQNFTYKNFYEEELRFRKLFEYPPFFKIGEIIFYGKNLRSIANKAREFFSKLKTVDSEIKVLGPVLLPKIQNKFRIRVIIKAKEEGILKKYIKDALKKDFKKLYSFTYI